MIDDITRQNIDEAESMGLLDPYKIKCGAPLYYRYVTRDEVKVLVELGINYYKRADEVQGPVFDGFVDPETYGLIRLYYTVPVYAGMTLTEFLRKIHFNG